MRDAELMQELLEDGELGLQGLEVGGAEVGAVIAEELGSLGVGEGGEAGPAAGGSHCSLGCYTRSMDKVAVGSQDGTVFRRCRYRVRSS